MELFTNQILAGIASGAIYACMALAVVMIYEAIDHINFAQGEMAMFSTFISWQFMQWGLGFWWAFIITVALSFVAGILIERVLFKPLVRAPVLTNVAGFIALFYIINSSAGLIWDFTIKEYPTPFGSAPFLGSQLISSQLSGADLGFHHQGVSHSVRVSSVPRKPTDQFPSSGHDLGDLPAADFLVLLLPVHADGTGNAGRRVTA